MSHSHFPAKLQTELLFKGESTCETEVRITVAKVQKSQQKYIQVSEPLNITI